MKKFLQAILAMVLVLITGNNNIYAQEKEKSFEISLGMFHLRIKKINFHV